MSPPSDQERRVLFFNGIAIYPDDPDDPYDMIVWLDNQCVSVKSSEFLYGGRKEIRMLDRNKPVQIRDGREVVIYTWDGPVGYPIHGLIVGDTFPTAWTKTGRSVRHGDQHDLMNIQVGGITPEMIKAGVFEFQLWHPDYDSQEDLVCAVYRAMLSKKTQTFD
jgi:hypothetical protein